MFERVARVSAGRRSKWVVIAIWLLLVAGAGSQAAKLNDAATNEPQDFLPSSSQSTKVVELLEDKFPGGNSAPAVVVYTKKSKLTPAEGAAIARQASGFPKKLKEAELAGEPFAVDGKPTPGAGAEGLLSSDGTTALVIVSMPGNASAIKTIENNVGELRSLAKRVAPGVDAYVTGTAGIIVDESKIMEGIDGKLLFATVTLVLVLLLLVYRSPIIALVPLFVVGFAYAIAAGLVYLIIKATGMSVDSQTTSLLIVLMYGAGTDYSLLLVSRFREELHEHEDRHEAMAAAVRRTAPAVLSAGSTVVLAMLVLLLADLKSTSSMGPTLAVGIAVMVVAGLTLLPAILAVLGRGAFWPARPKYGEQYASKHKVWKKIGGLVSRHPVAVMSSVIVLLLAGALGNLNYSETAAFGVGFREKTDSGTGSDVIDKKFPAGELSPSIAVVAVDQVPNALKGLKDAPGVAKVDPGPKSFDGKLAQVSIVLSGNPLDESATDKIPKIRDSLEEAVSYGPALVGGYTAENYDTDATSNRDTELLAPLILAVIFLVLMVLLRALVAPLYLILTVVLSFSFSLGVSILLLSALFGIEGLTSEIPFFSFIFLVALGVDYNIFLMSRAKEESQRLGARSGILEALDSTGGVIGSAGLILAGTFGVFLLMPIDSMVEIGFIVAFGVLIDTFIVRTLLVPAITYKLGGKAWWPGHIKQSDEKQSS